MQGHVEGWFLTYGGNQALYANANYRGYSVEGEGYRRDCMVAAMSPSNLGQIVWLRPSLRDEWFGPCLVVDTVSRVDWYHSVVNIQDIAEIPRWLMNEWGTHKQGIYGEAYFGVCPPRWNDTVPQRYLPPIIIDHYRPVVQYSGWPYPAQQFPIDCTWELPRGHVQHE
jgi:hypothetical protein